jgi:hypothetical protein
LFSKRAVLQKRQRWHLSVEPCTILIFVVLNTIHRRGSITPTFKVIQTDIGIGNFFTDFRRITGTVFFAGGIKTLSRDHPTEILNTRNFDRVVLTFSGRGWDGTTTRSGGIIQTLLRITSRTGNGTIIHRVDRGGAKVD